MPEPVFFATPAKLNLWFRKHHRSETELLAGFYKKGTGKPSITWPESVDEALCFGWIDGIRRRIDEERYSIRFTPRRPNSIWSARNLERVAVLTREGRMREAGLQAFAKRTDEKSVRYTYEQQNVELAPRYEKQLRARRAAWKFFQELRPSYRKPSIWWVMSAKKEETRQRRLEKLIECSANGEILPAFIRPAAAKKGKKKASETRPRKKK